MFLCVHPIIMINIAVFVSLPCSGKWVQTTHVPTPLGGIFHNTDLNHAGYSLDNSSVPLCEDVDEYAERRHCFLRQRKKFIWENRNFNVESKAVLDYIENVVLFGQEKERTCKEVKNNLPKNFVLYNVWCSKPYRWHLATSNGKKACVYGTSYPIDITNEATKGSLLFDTNDKCCSTFPESCRVEAESNAGNRTNFTGEMVLFHDYHTKGVADRAEREQEKKFTRAKMEKRKIEKTKKVKAKKRRG